MSDGKLARTIFERWSSNLKDKDRTWKNVQPNFEELFYELYAASIPFEVAHELMKEAILAHMPSPAVARNTYRAMKNKHDKNEHEFLEEWKKYISDCGHQAFYAFFKADPNSEEGASEEKKFGNMSAKEYRLQRSYAEAFPILDTAAIEKRLEQGVGNIEDFLKALENGD